MKWLSPEPQRPYRISECGRWMLNRALVRGEPVYMLVKLGKQRKTARGETLWEGSEIVKVGARAECEGVCGEQS